MAENKRYYWLKLMDDFFDSKRIKKLRKMAGGDTYTIIYLKMQLLSLKKGGYLEYSGLEDEFYKEIALDIDEDEINVQVTIQYLLSCGLLETSDSIEYKLPFVQDNLGSETASTRRSRKSRENAQKSLQCNSGATECNILQQNCNVEIDIEKDIDTDIEIEKENTKESVPASDLDFDAEWGWEYTINAYPKKTSLTSAKVAWMDKLLEVIEPNRKAVAKLIYEASITISTGAKSVSEIRAECRHQRYDVIVIDYLQLIKADRRFGNRASEVGDISKAIKALAMELHVPIIVLSQLNRISEMRETKEPTMAELRESGDVEQDASNIILLWNLDKDGKYKGWKIEKQRQGTHLKEVLQFDGDHMRFIERTETIEQIQARMQQKDGFREVCGSTPFD